MNIDAHDHEQLQLPGFVASELPTGWLLIGHLSSSETSLFLSLRI